MNKHCNTLPSLDDMGLAVKTVEPARSSIRNDEQPEEQFREALAVAVSVAFPRTVTCAWCGNRYRSSCPSDLDRGLQGSHCASYVVQEGEDWFVHGGYGSDEHDMHRYLFVANKPSAPADPVCDECISERLQAGALRDTGLECIRRSGDFGPRPFGTWGLIDQIRELVESTVAMRRLVDAACRDHDQVHSSGDPVTLPLCEVCAAIREYRKHQRWIGELVDGGEEYVEGCSEVAGQLREAARQLEDLAALWERSHPPKESPMVLETPASTQEQRKSSARARRACRRSTRTEARR